MVYKGFLVLFVFYQQQILSNLQDKYTLFIFLLRSPMATSSSVHDQTASLTLLSIKPNQNMIIELNPFLYDAYMLQVVECLKYSPLVLALTQVEAVPMSLLSQVYSTATYDKNKERIYFVIHDKKASVSKVKFCSILPLAIDSSVISPDFITTTQLFSMLYEMGYTDVLTTITKVKKSCLPRYEHRNRVPAFGTGTASELPVLEPELP